MVRLRGAKVGRLRSKICAISTQVVDEPLSKSKTAHSRVSTIVELEEMEEGGGGMVRTSSAREVLCVAEGEASRGFIFDGERDDSTWGFGTGMGGRREEQFTMGGWEQEERRGEMR
ncbi:hypothetical protein Ancab_034341 [Ancistrocladus abbreviatus]